MTKRCDQVKAWQVLQQLKVEKQTLDLRNIFASQENRFEHFSLSAPHVFVDFSKCMWDEQVEDALLELAGQTDTEQLRDAMFAGELINTTEQRAVMHWLLRVPNGTRLPLGLEQSHKEVIETLERFLSFAELIRVDNTITDVVNIGIGGSDLGPQMAVKALDEFVIPTKRFHFLSNIDAHESLRLFRKLKPESTLFLIASKSFSTLETMTNAALAKEWYLKAGGKHIQNHFVGLTSNTKGANAFGITTTFGFWDWVGGRYSMWSSIGLSIAIAIGEDGFKSFLRGAFEMDHHFKTAGARDNLPLKLGLLDIWYRNFLNYGSRSIAPYHSGLSRLPAYLQQLEMESNGKSVDKFGLQVKYGTAPVLWGEPGTNGQHAFFQMLHQGTDVIPVEFLVVKDPSHTHVKNHELLLANALAQAQAFMIGESKDAKDLQTAPTVKVGDWASHQADSSQHAARRFPGNRPSLFFALERLTPESLGALIALSEHRTFVAGAVWGINSFDQFGVELGKKLTQNIVNQFDVEHPMNIDPSTQGLMIKLKLKSVP
jgi:glucose-6-phosphate isomerase